MKTDIYNNEYKYKIIYAAPPWRLKYVKKETEIK